MTDQEAVELYKHVLVRLRELNAIDLVQEIEVTVGRGALRSEPDRKTGARQTVLSPHEALVVALRMLVASVEPPVHTAEAENILTTRISWSFDELEPQELRRDAETVIFPQPRTAPQEAPVIPSLRSDDLRKLCSSAGELLSLVQQTEQDTENADAD